MMGGVTTDQTDRTGLTEVWGKVLYVEPQLGDGQGLPVDENCGKSAEKKKNQKFQIHN